LLPCMTVQVEYLQHDDRAASMVITLALTEGYITCTSAKYSTELG